MGHLGKRCGHARTGRRASEDAARGDTGRVHPEGHPIRRIRAIVDAVLEKLSPQMEAM